MGRNKFLIVSVNVWQKIPASNTYHGSLEYRCIRIGEKISGVKLSIAFTASEDSPRLL